MTLRELTNAIDKWVTETVEALGDFITEVAGMHLHERCAGWQGEAFTGQSEAHVSVWQRD